MDIKDSTWHAIQRTASVIAVLAVVLLPVFFGYNMGYKKGVSTCINKPMYDIAGNATITTEKQQPQPWIFGIKIMKVGFGFVVDRNINEAKKP